MSWNKHRPMVLAIALIVACDRSPSELAPADTHVLPATASTLARVANATSIALSDLQVRRFIIDAMARSPWVEHKVALADAFTAGSPLLARASIIAGMSEAEFAQMVHDLPDMDFYLADKKMRRTWTALGQPASVAVSGDGDNYIEFGATGQSVVYKRSETSRALFAIHPAEVKMYRAERAAPSHGVISGPGNVEGGLLIRIFDESGAETTIDAGKLGLRNGREVRAYLKSRGIEPLSASEQPQGGAMVANLYLDLAHVSRIIDGVGQAEVLLKMWKDNGPGNGDCCRQEWNYGSVEELDTLVGDPCPTSQSDPNYYTFCDESPAVVFSGWYPGTGGYSHFRVQLFEEDTGTDDEYGINYWGSGYGTNGQLLEWFDLFDCDQVTFSCLKIRTAWVTS